MTLSLEEFKEKYKNASFQEKLDLFVSEAETVGDFRIRAAFSEFRTIHDSYLKEAAMTNEHLFWLRDELKKAYEEKELAEKKQLEDEKVWLESELQRAKMEARNENWLQCFYLEDPKIRKIKGY